jgi:lysophospholipase L1-like esterase
MRRFASVWSAVAGCGVMVLGLSSCATSSHRAPARTVAVIGDSVFATIQQRLATGELHGVENSDRWVIDAQSGFGWGASNPTWPLSVTRGSWVSDAAKHLLADHPQVLVVELGVNDALRATFADALKEPRLSAQIRDGVVDEIRQLLAQTSNAVSCTVLVAPPVVPTTLFGAGVRYALEAVQIHRIIYDAAANRLNHGVAVVDWSVASLWHDLPNSNEVGWFAVDAVHPDVTGDQAILSLIGAAASNCQNQL